MDLFRFLPNPTFIDKVLITYEAAPFLALSARQNLASEITNEDLLRCTRYDGVWHCPHFNKLSKNPQTICSYSLFFDLDSHKYCTAKISHKRNFAHQITQGSYAIGSLEPYSLGITCASGTNWTTQPAGVNIIRLPPGCTQISAHDTMLYANPEISGEADIIQRPVTIPKDLLQLGMPEALHVHDEIVNHFLSSPNLAPALLLGKLSSPSYLSVHLFPFPKRPYRPILI